MSAIRLMRDGMNSWSYGGSWQNEASQFGKRVLRDVKHVAGLKEHIFGEILVLEHGFHVQLCYFNLVVWIAAVEVNLRMFSRLEETASKCNGVGDSQFSAQFVFARILHFAIEHEVRLLEVLESEGDDRIAQYLDISLGNGGRSFSEALSLNMHVADLPH